MVANTNDNILSFGWCLTILMILVITSCYLDGDKNADDVGNNILLFGW